MSKAFIKCSFLFALMLISLFCVIGCSKTPNEPSSPIITLQPTEPSKPQPTPEVIIGTEYEGNPGIINITAALSAAIGSSYTVNDSVFVSENTLLTLASNGTGSIIAYYNLITGQIGDKYILPATYQSLHNYAYSGLITPLQSGGVLIVDVTSGDVLVLDKTLTEISRYQASAPAIRTELRSDLDIVYSEAENALYYCYISISPTIYKKTLDNNTEAVFYESAYTDNCITDMSITRDCSRLNVKLRGVSYDLTPGKASMCESVIIDTATGAATSNWINTKAFSDGESKLFTRYYHYISDAVVNDIKLKLDYLQEYDAMLVDFESNAALTAMEARDSNGNTMVLSMYDLSDGKLLSRACVDPGRWVGFTPNAIDDAFFSYDASSGNVAFAYRDSTELTELVTTLIWKPESGKIDDISDVEQLLTRTENAVYSGSADTLRDTIEEAYDVNIFYGDEFIKEMEIDSTSTMRVETFNSDADELYIYEVLLCLEKALSRYPQGMIKAISESAGGKLSFFLCTQMSDSSFELDLAGRYFTLGGIQRVFAKVTADSQSSFINTDTSAFESLFHHELCHAIQRVIMEECADISGYTYDEWTRTWPASFVFDQPENSQYVYTELPEDAYFIDEYSMTSILEDMSRIFENAMQDQPPERLQYPRINQRLKYLSELIREAFGNADWDDVVRWERWILD